MITSRIPISNQRLPCLHPRLPLLPYTVFVARLCIAVTAAAPVRSHLHAASPSRSQSRFDVDFTCLEATRRRASPFDSARPTQAGLSDTCAAAADSTVESMAASASRASREPLPVLFVSHGSPMAAIEQDETSAFWARLGKQISALPGVRAILVISAHWESDSGDARTVQVNAARRPETIHDFYGFPRDLYTLQYPVQGDPALAARVVEVLSSNYIPAETHPTHGLDHGAWVPLRWMLPRGDLPVVQLSLLGGGLARGLSRSSLHAHVSVGRALRALRREGVLVVGSGGAVHNLRDVGRYMGTDKVASYVAPFDSLLEDIVVRSRSDEERLERLLDLSSHPLFPKAHPTIEHLLPLYVAVGAGMDGRDAAAADGAAAAADGAAAAADGAAAAAAAAAADDDDDLPGSTPTTAPPPLTPAIKLFHMHQWTLSNAAFSFGGGLPDAAADVTA